VSRLEYKLLATNLSLAIVLALFTYAYVDLNLTLTKNTLILNIISKLQYFGYYQRLHATVFYFLLLLAFYVNYITNLILFIKKRLSLKYLLVSTLFITIILIPSYPFLSSDLFNYMFDAKIITTYNLNPYSNKPLDFPNDDWIRFMRWTHRYSPYGPLWLIYSTLPSLLGFGKFLLTLFTFKIFIGIFHILNTLLIYKILQRLKNNLSIVGTALYAMNPVFLIEGVTNAHNDIIHAFFIILSIYFLTYSKILLSTLPIIIGAFVKYLSLITLLPLLIFRFTKFNKIETYIYINIIVYSTFTWIFSTFRVTVPFISAGSLQTQFQPWYLFWTLPLVSFLPKKTFLLALSIVIGFSSMLRYTPFLLYGEWSQPNTILFMQTVIVILPAITILIILLKKYYEKIVQ